MNTSASPRRLLRNAHVRLRTAAIRRQLQSVADGRSNSLVVDLGEKDVDVAAVVANFTSPLERDGLEMHRIVAAMRRSGAIDGAIDGLGSRDPETRASSARLIGAVRLEQAVAWIAPLLTSRDQGVAEASARALGRIGGVRAAEALLLAIQRLGVRRMLVAQLAQAAPDLFLEVALSSPQRSGVQAAVAIAAGLRRRQASVGPLLALLVTGSRRQRVISCRALGWIGARTAIPLISEALEDREWRVRVSAAKAMASMHAPLSPRQLDALLADPHRAVRSEGLNRLPRLGAVGYDE
jgi:HEAT repeat protein